MAQRKFVSETQYKNNLVKQQKLSSQTVAQLRKNGITETTELKLEYFFNTNTVQKAKELTSQLQVFGYEAEFKKKPDNPSLYLITGWEKKMKMSEKLISEWTKVMCDLGYEFDCDFEGWRTGSR
jgi:hypothetical protein